MKTGITSFECHKTGHNLKEGANIPKKDKDAIFAKTTRNSKGVDGSKYKASPKKRVESVKASTAKDAEHEEGGVEPCVKTIVTPGLSEDFPGHEQGAL